MYSGLWPQQYSAEMMGFFKNPEHEPIRVQKLNSLELRVSVIEAFAVSGAFGGILPVVDGSIPPVFLQNPDGSLIYARIT